MKIWKVKNATSPQILACRINNGEVNDEIERLQGQGRSQELFEGGRVLTPRGESGFFS